MLAPVVQFLKQGWPITIDKDSSLIPFFRRREELSLFEGCILWGARVVIPSAYQEAILCELHEGHPGMVRMKSLARSYVWWPGLDGDIETTVQLCSECQMSLATPARAPLHPWSWPARPWARLHIDYAGPVNGKMFLVIIDSHYKWIEAFNTSSATSAAVIEELRPLFACFGLPETIVSDNGTCFVSTEFEDFLATNGIRHVTSAPYHPAYHLSAVSSGMSPQRRIIRHVTSAPYHQACHLSAVSSGMSPQRRIIRHVTSAPYHQACHLSAVSSGMSPQRRIIRHVTSAPYHPACHLSAVSSGIEWTCRKSRPNREAWSEENH